MTYAQERADVEARLNTNWTTTSIAWDNVAFIPTPGTAWIRCTILSGDADPLSFGQDTDIEYSGLIDIGIFVPKDTGNATARGYADTLAAIFDMTEFGTVVCGPASVQNLGEDNGWYHLSISVSFARIE